MSSDTANRKGGRQRMIRIEDEQFDLLRESMNNMLAKILGEMIKEEILIASFNAKVKISMGHTAVPLTEKETRIARIPQFDFKVTAARQIKHEYEGEIYEDQMEIVVDEYGNVEYKKIPTGQMSLFDGKMEDWK